MTGYTPKKDPLNDQRPTKERGGGILFFLRGGPIPCSTVKIMAPDTS